MYSFPNLEPIRCSISSSHSCFLTCIQFSGRRSGGLVFSSLEEFSSLLWSTHSKAFSSVQSLNCVRLFVTPWIAACQASLSITNSQSSLRFMSIESVMPSSHLILCRPFLLLPSIPPSIRVFSNESTLHTRWPKYWSFSFSIIPSNTSLPKRGDGDSGMIRNSCENSTESQLQDKE